MEVKPKRSYSVLFKTDVFLVLLAQGFGGRILIVILGRKQ